MEGRGEIQGEGHNFGKVDQWRFKCSCTSERVSGRVREGHFQGEGLAASLTLYTLFKEVAKVRA